MNADAVTTIGQILADNSIIDVPVRADALRDNEKVGVAVRAVGGTGDVSYLPISELSVDVFCYGETRAKARELGYKVHDVLKAYSGGVVGKTRVTGLRCDIPPMSVVDAALVRPYTVQSWTGQMGAI